MRRIYYRGEEDCKHESDFYLLSAVFCLLSLKKQGASDTTPHCREPIQIFLR